MTTSLDTRTAPRYVDFDEYIDFQLQRTGHTVKWTDILTAAATVATLFLGYLLVFVVFDHWIVPGGFGYLPRLIMLAALIIGTTAWVVWRVAVPWFRRISRLYAARVIERAQPELKSGLMNLVDLRRAGRPVPPDVMTALEKRAAITMSHMDVDHVVDRRPLLRVVYALVAVILLATLYAAFTPKRVSDSVRRALFPAADVEAPTETEIVSVQPGENVEVLSGTQLEVVAEIRGLIPPEVRLLFSTDDREFVDAPLVMRDIDDSRRRYRAILTGSSGRGIQQNMTYRIVAGDDTSRGYRVTVIQPPSATVDELEYSYPGYMGLEDRTQAGGEITGWEGTQVTFAATSNVPVASAKLLFSNDKLGPPVDIVPMERLEGNQLRARWTLAFDRSGGYPAFYRIECRDERGLTDPEPTVYTIKILPDRVPEVRLIDPRGNLERPANATVPLLVDARDDFRVRELRLRMRRNGEEVAQAVELFRGDRPSVVDQHEWALEPHGFQPGDVVSYWIEAVDNREPHANIGRSAEREIRIVETVPPEEAAEQLEADKRRQEQELERAQREAPPDTNDAARDQPEQPTGDQGQPPENNPQQPMEQPPADEQRNQNGDAGEQPMDRDAAEQNQPNDGQGGRDGGAGDQQAPPDGQAAPQDGQGGQGSGGAGGPQQPLDPDNPEDATRALEEYLRQLEKQNQGGGQGDPPQGDPPRDGQPGGPQQEQPDGGGNRRQSPSDATPPRNGTPQPGDNTQPQPGDRAEPQPGDNAQPQPGDNAQPQPGENTQPQPGAPQPGSRRPENGTDRQEQQNPANDTDGGNERAPNAAERQPGGPRSDQGAGPMDPMNPAADNEPPPAGADSAPGEASDRQPQQDTPGDRGSSPGEPMDSGTREPADGSGNAERRDATGGERGMGTPDSDPNAQPMPAENDLQRQNGTAPATRQNGTPPMGDQEQQPADDRRGSNNPNAAEPSPMTRPGAQQQPDAEQQPGPRDGPRTNGPPSRRDDQQRGADEQPSGPGRPDGQRAEQSDTGEGGMGTETTQGTPGSNRPGPGDMTDEPGANQEAERETGRPGDERGPGSTSRPASDGMGDQPPSADQRPDGPPAADRRQDGRPENGRPVDDQRDVDSADRPGQQDGEPRDGEPGDRQPGDGMGEAQEGNRPDREPADAQPGEGEGRGGADPRGADPSGRRQPQPGEAARDDESRGGRQPTGGGVPGSGDSEPSNEATPARAADAANPEYGREAANMVLRRLQDEIQRGEINEEWLKRTGWTEEQARRFTEQLEDHLQDSGPPQSPEDLARRRQFDEFLRSLKPRGPGEVRRADVRNRQDVESFERGRQYVPPEYRDIAEEYSRGIFSRETNR